jgi:hypothetical protein
MVRIIGDGAGKSRDKGLVGVGIRVLGKDMELKAIRNWIWM